MPPSDPPRRLYKARRPDGEMAWVDHDELWRLQQGQAARLRREQARRRRIAVAVLCALVALVVTGVAYRLWSTVGKPARGVAAPVESVSPAAAAEPGSPSGGPAATAAPGRAAAVGGPLPPTAGAVGDLRAGPSSEGATAPRPAPAPTERVESAVRAWVDAWARQDVAAYLASYAAGFEPPEGQSRSDWVSLRRRRILDRASIRLEIEELEIELRGAGRAEARFRQSYSSPSYSDVVRKTLVLAEDGGDWRIVAERSSAP